MIVVNWEWTILLQLRPRIELGFWIRNVSCYFGVTTTKKLGLTRKRLSFVACKKRCADEKSEGRSINGSNSVKMAIPSRRYIPCVQLHRGISMARNDLGLHDDISRYRHCVPQRNYVPSVRFLLLRRRTIRRYC